MDRAAFVLHHDFDSLCLDEREWIRFRKPFSLRRSVFTAVLVYSDIRGSDASGISVLVLSADQRKDRIPAMDGLYQCPSDFRSAERYKSVDAFWRIPPRLHKRVDEREHGDLVWHHTLFRSRYK